MGDNASAIIPATFTLYVIIVWLIHKARIVGGTQDVWCFVLHNPHNKAIISDNKHRSTNPTSTMSYDSLNYYPQQ